MFEGKENHLDLIQELRTVHALQREEQELQGADRRVVIALKKQRDDHRHEVEHAQAFLQTLHMLQSHHPPSLSLSPRPLKRRPPGPEWWASSWKACSTPCPRS